MRSKTGGSPSNPDGHRGGLAVCSTGRRGATAQVSTSLPGSTGDVTSADIEALGEERRRVSEAASGIERAETRGTLPEAPGTRVES